MWWQIPSWWQKHPAAVSRMKQHEADEAARSSTAKQDGGRRLTADECEMLDERERRGATNANGGGRATNANGRATNADGGATHSCWHLRQRQRQYMGCDWVGIAGRRWQKWRQNRRSSELQEEEVKRGEGRLGCWEQGKEGENREIETDLGLIQDVLCVYIYKGNFVISLRVPAGTGVMIPAPAPFNKWVFKPSIPIIRGWKILPPYPPRHGYYPRVPMGAGKIDIPNHTAPTPSCPTPTTVTTTTTTTSTLSFE